MKYELINAISNITDRTLISNMIHNMSVRDISILLSLLQLTNEETKDLWLQTYSNVLSGIK